MVSFLKLLDDGGDGDMCTGYNDALDGAQITEGSAL